MSLINEATTVNSKPIEIISIVTSRNIKALIIDTQKKTLKNMTTKSGITVCHRLLREKCMYTLYGVYAMLASSDATWF